MINRKQISNDYKQTIQPMGIFQIRNISNGKIFIEKSKNLNAAKNSCFFQLKLGTYMNHKLQADFTTLGEHQFVFEILDQLKPNDKPNYDYNDDLETLRLLWLEKLNPYNEKGYHTH